MYEIILQENKKVSADKEAHGNIESDFDDIELNQIDSMSLDETMDQSSVCSGI